MRSLASRLAKLCLYSYYSNSAVRTDANRAVLRSIPLNSVEIRMAPYTAFIPASLKIRYSDRRLRNGLFLFAY